jgi:hypothetical protein
MQNEADLLDTDLLPIRTAEGIPPAVCEAAISDVSELFQKV